jgi:heme/copper-type cytochrome/quinol oxidase subunit 2
VATVNAVDSAALEKARLDSIQATTARDLAAKAAAAKKAKAHNTVLLAVIAIIALLIIILVVVMVVRGRKKPDDIATQEGKDRFGNL